MKRILKVLIVLFLVLFNVSEVLALSPSISTNKPNRTINLVYDDSGSMISLGLNDGTRESVDTWCQAKYALEVVTAMLTEQDTLNIYYMSDYFSNPNAGPRLTLKGGNSMVTEKNVKQVHETVTSAADTPFGVVRNAFDDLKVVNTDEKWLVVLTDGILADGAKAEYDLPSDKVYDYYREFTDSSDVKIMMLSMGPYAAQVKSDETNNIYTEKAETTSEILGKLTGICNRIFQNNTLNVSDNSLSFNVPMGKLIVFAQGPKVSISGITNSAGETFMPTSNVKVSYSDQATVGENPYWGDPKDWIIDKDLNGVVATFDNHFVAGDYKINLNGAQSVEVYYAPDVVIKPSLIASDGHDATQDTLLGQGTYQINFDFADAVTGEIVEDTSLLGDIIYSAEINNVTNNGDVNTFEVTNGDTITIKEGNFEVDAVASFLKYNTVSSHLGYEVFVVSKLIFDFENNPIYKLTTDGFENGDEPVELVVKIDNGSGVESLTSSQWDLLDPEFTIKGNTGDFKIEKSDTIGKFLLYPTLVDNDPMKTKGGDVTLIAHGFISQGKSNAEGSFKGKIIVDDNITTLQRILNWIKNHPILFVGILLSLIVFFGNIFKKRFPKKMARKPVVHATPERAGAREIPDSSGRFNKNFMSIWFPFIPETGTLKFNGKSLQLEAGGGTTVLLKNAKTYAGKGEYLFSGKKVPDKLDRNPFTFMINMTVVYKTKDYTYTCKPCEDKNKKKKNIKRR